MASHLHSEDAWTRARNRYMEDLTHEEKQLYMQASQEMIFYDASAAEKRHGASSKSRGLMDKLQPFVAAIEQYGQALDVYSNAYPLALSPIWGSIRVVLLIAREFGKYFEKLVDMFARIGDVLPQFQVYEKLFPNHERLTHALSVAYVDVIVFCSDAKAVFRRGQRDSLTSLKVGFKLMWKPFESQFGQQLDNFRNHRRNVEKEAGLSHMVEAAEARALALANHLQLEKTKKEDERRRIIAMIASIDVEAKHRKLQSLRFHGTGNWLLQNDKYVEWKHASSSSSLCCYGIPGSGKSVLASRIIDDLSITAKAPQVAIVYYYCDYADQRTLQTDRILGTILKQLIPGDRIPEEIGQQILRAYQDGQRTPGTYELMELVCSFIQLHRIAYIILDGLDECERQPRQDILSFLERLSKIAKTSIYNFVSCRDEDQLLRSLNSYTRIQLTAAALGSDIQSFVEGSVRSRIEAGHLTIRNPDLEHHIVRELVNKSHGMFLWVFFQLDDLCEAVSDAMIRQTLRNLPVGLVDTYERILLKISKSPLAKQEIALRVFRWTVCSRRPMKAEELQEAVAFESSDKFWDRDKIPDENLMIETCRGLLVRDEEDRTVRFAHHTVQQYLLSRPTIRTQEGARLLTSPRSEAEAFVGQVCVTYLCFSDFETQIAIRTPNVHLEPLGVLKAGGPVRIPTVLGIGKSLFEIPYRLLGGKSTTVPINIDYSKYLTPSTRTRPQVPSGLMEKYRLLGYVVEYWMDHTKELEPALDAKFRLLIMYKTLSFEFRPWGSNQHLGPYGCVSCTDLTKAKELPFMSLFHYAAQTGHWNLMESLATEYCQHEVPSDETLLIACCQGQHRIVQKLMQRIKFNISDGRAVNVAAAAGHADVVIYLVDYGQNSAEGSSYDIVANACSLLNLAATNGHEEVVDIILTYCHCRDDESSVSFHINESHERTGRTAFFSAVMSGNESMVRNLLAKGAEIKAHGNTALHIAAECGHQKILRMLLEVAAKGFDTDNDSWTNVIVNEDGTKPRMFCSLNSPLRSFDNKGDIPLHKTARNGHTAVARLILEYVPCFESRRMHWEVKLTEYTNSKLADGYTALHLAARGGHQDVLQILIEDGARIEAKTLKLEWRALHLAAAEGHEAVVQLLLKHGADPLADAKDGTKALQIAVSGGHDGVVRVLLTYPYEKKRPYYGHNVILSLMELAVKNREIAVMCAIFECSVSLETSSTFAEGWRSRLLDVAKRERQNPAADLLMHYLDEGWPAGQFGGGMVGRA